MLNLDEDGGHTEAQHKYVGHTEVDEEQVGAVAEVAVVPDYNRHQTVSDQAHDQDYRTHHRHQRLLERYKMIDFLCITLKYFH